MRPLKIGHHHHFKWLRGIIAVIIVLNLADAILTCIWLWSGAATEANPVMRMAAGLGPVAFVSVKLALVSLGTFLLWRLRYRAFAVVAIFALFLAYYFVLLYHLQAMNVSLLDKWI